MSVPAASPSRWFLKAVPKGTLVLALLVLGAAIAFIAYRRSENARSELSPAEWFRLKQRVFRHAEQAPESSPAEGDAVLEREERVPPIGAVQAAQAVQKLPERPHRLPRPAIDPDEEARQDSEYRANRSKSVIELQRLRWTETIPVRGSGGREGTATLINLNPTINAWYILQLSWSGDAKRSYHLVNSRPEAQDLTLDPERPGGLVIASSLGRASCELWSDAASVGIDAASSSSSPYVPLCDEAVTLRLPTPGRRTTLEWATDFLRDNVRGGESITVFVREKFFQDAFLDTSELVPGQGEIAASPPTGDFPRAARLNPSYQQFAVAADQLGLSAEGKEGDALLVGRWYRWSHPGVFVNALVPDVLGAEILESDRGLVSPLDPVETEALVYLVAFDLDEFDLGFALGTEHPRVDWSERALPSVRDSSLPGPDGIGDISPLVTTGIIPRSEAERTVAAFTGGFKRAHSAFRLSILASENHGSHYGFIESGTVLSKLQPGLATLYVLVDGTIGMKTWEASDDALLPRMKFARQNGVPIIDFDPRSGTSRPGSMVSKWGPGNWSGSQDKKFRTVRSGAAIQEVGGKRFLIYAYFSSATPSAMARVFQALDCKYAMLMDMNALEHTYLALYDVRDGELVVEHLVRGMDVLDRTVNGQTLPRFLGFADNRDFFYLLRRVEEAP